MCIRDRVRAHLEVVEQADSLAFEPEHVAALQMQDADKVGNDFVVALQAGGRAHISDVAAETGEILTEREHQAVGRALVVVERVVGQSVSGQRRQVCPLRKLLPDRQRRLK